MELVYGNYLSIMDIGTNLESVDAAFKEQEHARLTHIIDQWNSKRLDLFEISQPDQDLKYHGVMRFYWEDQVAGNVATKCLRVSCMDTAQDVTKTLLEKFRPDMKLNADSFSLYEVHINKDVRRLELNEKPLLVQLSWIKNNCEGRFVLRNTKSLPQIAEDERKEKSGVIQNFRKTLSKKEKKDKKRESSVGRNDSKEGKENGQNKKKQQTSPSKAPANTEAKGRGPGGSQDKAPGSQDQGRSQQAGPAVQNKENGPMHECSSARMLPVSIKLVDNNEEAFLVAIVSYTNSFTVHFPLSPAYAFYLVGRSLLGRTDSVHHVVNITNKMVALIETVVEKHRTIAVSLAFWMANASELRNFLRQDRDLNSFTRPAHSTLAQLVHQTFMYLAQRLQKDLEKHMSSFLTDAKEQTTKTSAIEGVLSCLVRAMSLLRRCRVNAALSIQLFSHLLHFISAWLVNWLLGAGPGRRGQRPRTSCLWLETLRQRLTLVSAWAERQGLELAADCHLSLVMQVITLLSMNAHTMQDTRRVQEACFKLNSLQIRTLMSSLSTIPTGMIDSLVAMAESTTDDLLKQEGWEIQLEVDVDLHLPFLLPEDGYTCDSMQGIPHGFRDFLEPICRKGFCSLMFHPFSTGTWTVFYSQTDSASSGSSNLCYKTNSSGLMKPEVVMIALKKPLHRGLGLSIVAAKGPGQNKLGIFIKSIVKGGAAHVEGSLTTGDQLLSVNGQSLVGLSQEKAADILLHTSSVVNLEVVKSAAVFYGLEDMLSQPPPVMSRGSLVLRSGCRFGVLQTCVQGGATALSLTTETDITASGTETPERPNPCRTLVGMRGNQNATVLMRKRKEFCSNPSLAYSVPDPGEISVDPVTPANKTISISTGNLLEDPSLPPSHPASLLGYQRDYLTLPAPRAHSITPAPEQTRLGTGHPKRPTGMKTLRYALSQENLCEERQPPSVPDRPQTWKSQFDLDKQETSSQTIAIPVRPNVNTLTSTTSQGHWRASKTGVLMKTSQPTRIDVPASLSHGLSFVTFRPSAALPAGDQSRGGCHTLARTSTHGAMLQNHQGRHPGHAPASYTMPHSCLPSLHAPQLRLSTPQQASVPRPATTQPAPQQASVPRPATTQPAPQQASVPRPATTQPTPQEPHSPQALASSLCPSSTPARQTERPTGPTTGSPTGSSLRKERGLVQKQGHCQAVNQLEQDVLQLQAKVQRTLEESERLRRLSLEWQFQKRLQEFQQSESDEGRAVDIKEHEQQQEGRKSVKTRPMEQSINQLLSADPTEGARSKIQSKGEVKGATVADAVESGSNYRAVHESHEGGDFRQVKAPEKLSFQERQRLFALAVRS